MRDLMMPLFRWWGETPVGATIRSSSALIALTQTIHLLGMTMLIGTLLMINLNLMGLGFRRRPTSQIAKELAPWTLGGLAAMLISGPLILSSETLKAYESSFFWLKMGLLAAAILFHFLVFRGTSRAEPPATATRRRVVACLSLGLWLGVALTGKMIGIYGDDLRQEDDPFHERAVTQLGASGHSPILNSATR
jgi:hypothetical protein